MNIECCATCYWCKAYEEEVDADVSHECRRYPPQVYGGTGDRAYSTYPGVHLEEFCGEWKEQQQPWEVVD